ncbi:MAG: ATP-binding cassette domain-containing protein [Fibrobacter sp.]|nr:ATP-binding cassette domain-containing protein [Fibrobacter sp.]
MANNNVIELDNIKKEYILGQTLVHALNGVSLTVSRNEFLALSGPSGSGKSTILNIVGCIDTPTSGSVIINNKNVVDLSDNERTRYRRVTISFIFQSFNLIPVLNVYENIELPLLLQKITEKKERHERVMHFISEVGLTDRIKNASSEEFVGTFRQWKIPKLMI